MRSRIIALWCPDWPIVAARAELAESLDDPQGALAIRSGHYIVACSPDSKALGVHPGQRVRDAQQRCPGLQLVGFSAERDQRVFDTVLAQLGELTPHCSTLEPGLIVARAQGLARYYGSEHAAAWQMVRGLENTPVARHARAAVADSLFAARLAVIHATSSNEPICLIQPGADEAFLSAMPIEVLEHPRMVPILRQLGVNTLSDFVALPAQMVAQRFGPEGAFLHSCAHGADSRVVHSDELPTSWERRWRTEQPITRVEQLADALRKDTDALIETLTRSHRVCQQLRVTLIDDQQRPFVRSWGHPRYFSATDILNRIRWQWQSEVEASVEDYLERGIVEVVLEPTHTAAISVHEPGLWGHSGSDSRLEHTLATLHSTLGQNTIARARLDEGYDWSERQELTAWSEAVGSTQPERGHRWPGAIPPPFPATVFQPALAVELRDQSGQPVVIDPEGATLSAEPVVLVSPRSQCAVSAWAGPWPVCERWWDRSKTRLCYRMQLLDEQGMGWLVSQHPPGSHWLLEARYD